MIYFIEAVGCDAVKVGYAARRADVRLADLQTGSHVELRLIGTIDGDYQEGADLHRRFQQHRIRGEWFRLSGCANEIAGLLHACLDVPRQVAAVPVSPHAMLSAVQAAEYLAVSVDTLSRWRTVGGGPAFVKFTRAKQGIVRYRREDLDAFVADRICASTSAVR